uniref:LOB domain-containing protein n=1 Tax=Chenopodium quinoa TaxID=63459 RepID=A0A803LB98_CHEQI
MVVRRSSCAFCTLRRRRCDGKCLLKPHFPQDGGNGKEKQASKILKVFGADARVRDLVGGCVRALENLAGVLAFYSDQLHVVTNMLSYIKLNPGEYPTPFLVGDDLAQSSQLLQPDDPFLQLLSDQIPNGEVSNEIEIGQAQATFDPPPYRVGDNQAQAPQEFFHFLPVPQLDLSGQIPNDGVDNQIDIGLEPKPNDVDDQIAVGLEPASNDGVDDQIEQEPEPKRRRFI